MSHAAPATESDRAVHPIRVFSGIQALRGIAAVMVVVHHSTILWGMYHGWGVWGNGAAGTDIFFIISGFVMVVATVGREAPLHPARKFLERRIARVVPLYWLITAVVVVKGLWVRTNSEFQNHVAHVAYTPAYVLRSLFFIPFKDTSPIVFTGWTLSYEMFFYLLFAIALALRIGVVRTLAPLLLILGAVGFLNHSGWPAIASLISPLLLEFLAGLLLGYAVLQGKIGNHWFMFVLGIAAMFFLCLVGLNNLSLRLLLWGVPAFSIVLGAVAMEPVASRWWPGWVLLIGDSSYSLYLSHVVVLPVVEKLLVTIHLLRTNQGGFAGEIPVVVMGSSLSIVVGLGVFLWIERPLNGIIRRHLLHERPQLSLYAGATKAP
jgi:peptidoglycan/LPS O-acetylase OafA/YrhL